MSTAPDPHVTAKNASEPEVEEIVDETEVSLAEKPDTDQAAVWMATDWLGKVVIDCEGQRIGKLHDIYVDVETDVPQFGTVKRGIFNRHLTLVPLIGVTVSPNELRITALKDQIRSAPELDSHGQEMSQEDESILYHYFQMNYTAIENESGRRLARR